MAETDSNIIQNQLNVAEIPEEVAVPTQEQTKKVKKSKDLYSEKFLESTKRFSLQTIFNKMAQSEQKIVLVKEIKLEESFDFAASVAQLQKTFEEEFNKKKEELNALFKTEVQNIKDRMAYKNMASIFAELLNKTKIQGWVFDSYNETEVISKYFSDPIPVTRCLVEGGLYNLEVPLCHIKAIHFNYKEKYIRDNIWVETTKLHPNVLTRFPYKACPGSLSSREINILEIPDFLNLLVEIEETYKLCNMTSAFNSVDITPLDKQLIKTSEELEHNEWY